LGASSGTRVVPAETVLFVVRGSSLKEEFRVGLTQREVAFGQDCKALSPVHGIDAHILFHGIHAARTRILELVDETSIGAGRLSTDLITKLEIRVPADQDISVIEEIRSLDQLSASRMRENYTLSALRDTLLLELMSGRLRVREAEKIVEEAV
jgi:type I restriction enzyme S subunit